jgi:two-component system, OmpR family, phosphate regulon sensor histidine kinase PhoR
MPNDPATPSLQNAEIERERLTSLVNSMADGVIAVDEKLTIVLTNGAALNILDKNGSLNGQLLPQVMQLLDKNNQQVDLRKTIVESRTSLTSRDWRLKYPDDSTINLYISIAPVRLGYGKEQGSHGYVVLLRDITREKSLEEERDEFISVVSHELRTPITIAEGNIGNAEFLLDKTGDANMVKDALKQAHTQTTFLAGLINDLATLSRAERGKLTVEVEPLNAHDLITELIKNYTPDAAKKGLELNTDIDPSLELLQSSRLYVREILQNFLTNAIKYTEQGHITLGATPGKAGVVFRVSDTGIGISKADQEKLFDKFFRSEDYRTRKNNGTGLGLYVTMKLARLIHAEIEVESELNKGSVFSIYIPNLQ